MAAQQFSIYRVIQFLPDRYPGERINIGVIACDDTDCEFRFIRNFARFRTIVGKKHAATCVAIVKALEADLKRMRAAGSTVSLMCPAVRLNREWLTRLDEQFWGCIAFAPVSTAVGSASDACLKGFKAHIPDREPPAPAGRMTVTDIVSRAKRAVEDLVKAQLEEGDLRAALSVLRQRSRVPGHVLDHSVDLQLAWSTHKSAALVISFDVTDNSELYKHLERTVLAAKDIRDHGDFNIAILADGQGRRETHAELLEAAEKIHVPLYENDKIDEWSKKEGAAIVCQIETIRAEQHEPVL